MKVSLKNMEAFNGFIFEVEKFDKETNSAILRMGDIKLKVNNFDEETEEEEEEELVEEEEQGVDVPPGMDDYIQNIIIQNSAPEILVDFKTFLGRGIEKHVFLKSLYTAWGANEAMGNPFKANEKGYLVATPSFWDQVYQLVLEQEKTPKRIGFYPSK